MKLFFVVLFSLDQFSKLLARFCFEKTEIVPYFFQLTFAQNPGIAFSIPVNRDFLLIFSVGVLIFFLHFLHRKNISPFEKFWATLVFAGAAGNFFDRLVFGQVSDFLLFFPTQNWPVFNFADVFIFLGLGFFLASETFGPKIKA